MDADHLAALRRSYARAGLDEADLAADPLTQLRRWLDDTVNAELPEPNAMVVATADVAGRPTARYVLLKGLDERGVVFYTNHNSAKGADLDANPYASVLFPWHALERQVRVTGPVCRVSGDETAAYFASRPRGSQLGAWASSQSEPAASRAELDAAYAETERRWQLEAAVPVPAFWGGYRVRIHTAEFWQGRENRLHDRLRYVRVSQDIESQDIGEWRVERLWP